MKRSGCVAVWAFGMTLLASGCGVAPSSSAVSRPLATGFRRISVGDARTGCAATVRMLLCTDNGGERWEAVPLADSRILQIQMLPRGIGVALGSRWLWRTGDGGLIWRRVRPNSMHLAAVDFTGPETGVARSTRGSLFGTASGGRIWVPLHAPGTVEAFDFRSARRGWVLTAAHRLYATLSGGATWVLEWQFPLWTPVGVPALAGEAQVRFPTRHTGWVLLTLGQGCASQMPYLLYRSSDGGLRWRRVLTGPGACGGPLTGHGPFGPGGYPGNLVVLGNRYAWLPVASQAGLFIQLASSRDGGRTWHTTIVKGLGATVNGTIGSPLVGPVAARATFPTPRNGWLATRNEAGTGGQILSSSNGGNTWAVRYPLP